MKKFLAVFATLFLVSFGAQAGILIDPYLGYMVSGSASPGDFKVSGTDMGARLGWSTFGFGIGIDATVGGTQTYKSGGSSTDYNPAHTGIFVSYKFPILVRGYATYFLNAKTKSGSDTNTGTATKIGVQYTGLPFIAIGLEIFNGNYDKQNDVTQNPALTDSQTRLALSVPFDI